MNASRRPIGIKLLKWVVVLLIVKVTVNVLSNYPDYFPASFAAEFLQERESYFHGTYQIAFYAHIVASPIALLSCLLLLNNRLRQRYRTFHRYLGRFNVFNIGLLVAPSGLWMSLYAYTGSIAGAGFAVQSILLAFFVYCGWFNACKQQFEQHRAWMLRCFILLNAAIVLRLLSGAATLLTLDPESSYRFAAWASWLVPLGLFEALRGRKA